MTFWSLRFSASLGFMTEAKPSDMKEPPTPHQSTLPPYLTTPQRRADDSEALRLQFSSHRQLEPFTEVVGWVRQVTLDWTSILTEHSNFFRFLFVSYFILGNSNKLLIAFDCRGGSRPTPKHKKLLPPPPPRIETAI